MTTVYLCVPEMFPKCNNLGRKIIPFPHSAGDKKVTREDQSKY